jgi:TetR/AcrR family transcriptional regulator, fatty acid metabolism regulator protein
MTLKQLKGKETKKKIFKASIHLFEEYGYDNVTVEQICNEVGIAKGTFYVHYNAKDDIPRSMYRSIIQSTLKESMEKFIEEYPNSTPKERLFHNCVTTLKFCGDIKVEITMLSYISNFKSIMNTKENLLKDVLLSEEFDQLIEQCAKDSNSYSEELCNYIHNFLCTVLNGAMIEWCFADGEYDIVERNYPYLEFIIKHI